MTRSKNEFVGSATRLAEKDFQRVAERLGCAIAAIRAVAEVESGGRGGFLKDKRPKILFESRWFHKLTDGRFDKKYPGISTPGWVRNYKGGAGEFDRLATAVELDRAAALKSASWGMFQILGVNHAVAGFPDVEAFVASQVESESNHLDAFASFVAVNRLDDELRDRRWADFAAGYNGPGYRENRYDEKISAAYAKYSAGRVLPSTLDVQQALNQRGATLTVDGVSGPNTRAALRLFQRSVGLPITGQADSQTLEALGLAETHDPLAVSELINP